MARDRQRRSLLNPRTPIPHGRVLRTPRSLVAVDDDEAPEPPKLVRPATPRMRVQTQQVALPPDPGMVDFDLPARELPELDLESLEMLDEDDELEALPDDPPVPMHTQGRSSTPAPAPEPIPTPAPAPRAATPPDPLGAAGGPSGWTDPATEPAPKPALLPWMALAFVGSFGVTAAVVSIGWFAFISPRIDALREARRGPVVVAPAPVVSPRTQPTPAPTPPPTPSAPVVDADDPSLDPGDVVAATPEDEPVASVDVEPSPAVAPPQPTATPPRPAPASAVAPRPSPAAAPTSSPPRPAPAPPPRPTAAVSPAPTANPWGAPAPTANPWGTTAPQPPAPAPTVAAAAAPAPAPAGAVPPQAAALTGRLAGDAGGQAVTLQLRFLAGGKLAGSVVRGGEPSRAVGGEYSMNGNEAECVIVEASTRATYRAKVDASGARGTLYLLDGSTERLRLRR